MKRNWEYKKLGEVVSFIGDGDWIESRHQSDNGIRLIQTGNIGNGVFKAKEDRPHFISESTFDELGCTEIYEGDCLVSRLPDPIGRACIIPNMQNRMITAVDCTILRFQKLVDSNFFVYYTRSKRYNKEIENYTTGSTRKRISRKNLESIQVPVPPISEQSKIVAELDLLTSIIDKQNAQLKEIDNLAQAIFYDMFGDPIENPKGWEVKLWGELFDTILGKMLDAKKQNPNDTVRSYLGNTNVQWFSFDLTALKTMTFSAKEMEKFALRKGDILLCEGGESGRCAVWEDDDSLVLFQKAIHRARVKDKALIEAHFIPFVIKFMREKGGLKNFVSKATIEHLTGEKLALVPIILPPLSLQQSFAEKIQSIEKQKEAIRASIADTQKLLDYTMDKYFG